MSNGLPRTFRVSPPCIELRAYIPNHIQLAKLDRHDAEPVSWGIAMEMAKGVSAPGEKELTIRKVAHAIYAKLMVSSNRAGLHLAYWFEAPVSDEDDRLKSVCIAIDIAILNLTAAGWKQCKGD